MKINIISVVIMYLEHQSQKDEKTTCEQKGYQNCHSWDMVVEAETTSWITVARNVFVRLLEL